jgi:hypothetical protein
MNKLPQVVFHVFMWVQQQQQQREVVVLVVVEVKT